MLKPIWYFQCMVLRCACDAHISAQSLNLTSDLTLGMARLLTARVKQMAFVISSRVVSTCFTYQSAYLSEFIAPSSKFVCAGFMICL